MNFARPDAAARPYSPPRLSEEDARRANRIARRCRPFPVRIGGLEIEAPLSITPALGPSAADAVAITWRIGGGRAVLSVPRLLVDTALAEIADVSASDIEPDVAALLLEALLAEWLPTVEARAGVSISVAAIEAGPPALAEPAFHCEIAISYQGVEMGLPLVADAEARPMLERLVDAIPALPAPLAALPVPLAIWFGAVRLALADLKGLAPGDVIFPDVASGADGALVTYGAWCNSARLEPGAAVITAPRVPLAVQDGGLWMTESNGDVAEAAARDLGEVPVTLVFELGRSELPLDAVQGLAPGAIVPLGRTPGEAVEIIANGRRIGRGEIVEIEGELGVRVGRLFGNE